MPTTDFMVGSDRSFALAREAADQTARLLASTVGERAAEVALSDKRHQAAVLRVLRSKGTGEEAIPQPA